VMPSIMTAREARPFGSSLFIMRSLDRRIQPRRSAFGRCACHQRR
jgi:hypothetical protein